MKPLYLLYSFSIFLLALGCTSSEKKIQESPLGGYWISEYSTINLDGEEENAEILAVFLDKRAQIYDIKNKSKSLDGTKMLFSRENSRIFAQNEDEKDPTWEASIEDIGEEFLLLNDFKSSDTSSDRLRFRRITYQDSQQYFENYRNNFNDHLAEELEKNKTEALTQDNLQGFWVFSGVVKDDSVYAKNALVPSTGDRVTDKEFAIHIKNNEILIMDESKSYPSSYRPFEITGNFIVADAIKIKDRDYASTKFNIKSINSIDSSKVFIASSAVTYGFDGDIFVSISDKAAEVMLYKNATYLKNFEAESLLSKDELSGFWILESFESEGKVYNLDESTDAGSRISNDQVIIHFKDDQFRQYFNTSSSQDKYHDYTINGSLISIPTIKSTIDYYLGTDIEIVSHFSSDNTQTLKVKRLFTPSFVQNEFYRKLSATEADDALKNNTAFNN